MTVLLLALVVIVIVAAAGVVVWSHRRRGVNRYLRQSIVVHTTDARTIKGVLIGEYADSLEIAHAEYVHGSDEALLAGKILLPRTRIAFVQIVPAEAK